MGSILEGLKIPFTKFLWLSNYSSSIRQLENQQNRWVPHIKPSIISIQILRHAIVNPDSDNGSFFGEIEIREYYFERE
jgi:hypothetical protein